MAEIKKQVSDFNQIIKYIRGAKRKILRKN